MQRFINNPDFVVEDMLKGFVKAHKEVELSNKNNHVVKCKKKKRKGIVGVVSGGGSGHEPAFLGYIGKNMLDAVAVGEVFSSPPATAFYEAFIEADNEAGVACLFGNYAGDLMNVKMAIQMAEDEGISVKYVCATDDISSSPKETKEKRHGIAGGVFMWKIGCAKASLGGTLDEVIKVSKKAVTNTRSICVGLSSCSIPAVGKENFFIEEGTMEFGIGHHGEPGMKVEKLSSAKEISQEMIKIIDEDIELACKDEVAIMLSGLGSTPIMELYILYDAIEKYLTKSNISIYKVLIGDYVTSLNMNGCALTLMKLDEEIKYLLDVPASAPGFDVNT